MRLVVIAKQQPDVAPDSRRIPSASHSLLVSHCGIAIKYEWNRGRDRE
jgi:hypothetical protein